MRCFDADTGGKVWSSADAWCEATKTIKDKDQVLCIAKLGGELYTGGEDRCLRIWDPTTGKALQCFATPEMGACRAKARGKHLSSNAKRPHSFQQASHTAKQWMCMPGSHVLCGPWTMYVGRRAGAANLARTTPPHTAHFDWRVGCVAMCRDPQRPRGVVRHAGCASRHGLQGRRLVLLPVPGRDEVGADAESAPHSKHLVGVGVWSPALELRWNEVFCGHCRKKGVTLADCMLYSSL